MTTTPTITATRREWIGLAVLTLPCLLAVMDLTVLGLAVPQLSATLKPSGVQLLWIVDIYGFMLSGALITMGTLGDRIGRRKLLLIGAAAFGLASVLAAFSNSAAMLIAMRAVLGIAGATLVPSTLSLIRNMFIDERQRNTAIAIWGASFATGATIGPLVGGVLLEHFWWGSAFLVSVPVMVLLLMLGPVLLPEFRDPNAARLDVPSAVLSMVAVLSAIFGLKQIVQDGLAWLPMLTVVTGLAFGVAFVQRQRTLSDPLIDLRLFHAPAFSVPLAANALNLFVSFGAFIMIAQYLQLVIGLSPLQAGLFSMPASIAAMVGSLAAPKIGRRMHPGAAIATCLTIMAVGFGLLGLLDGPSALLVLVTGWSLAALGGSAAFNLGIGQIVGSASPERAGAASATAQTADDFGGALGIAVLGTIGTAVYRAQLARTLPDGLPPTAALAARDTLGGAVTVAGQLPDQLGGVVLGAARTAFAEGLHLTALIIAVVTIGMAIITALALRPTPGAADSVAPPQLPLAADRLSALSTEAI
jgi:MFS transporter, DHA2 family, multidrug resistance protein